jgi:aspartate 1-decarboxylase
MLKSKIHNAKVSETNLEYHGSITIPTDLIEKVGMLPYEQVQVYNMSNGIRFETYVIEGEPGSGKICVNGAAARLASVGDRIIIAAYCIMTPEEAKTWKPKVIVL